MAQAKWQVIITKQGNGYTVQFHGGDYEDCKVYAENTEDGLMQGETDKSHIPPMLYNVLDYMAERGSKHDKKRIRISYE